MNANELKQRIPIEEVIGQYVPLIRQGHYYTGLCPFHDDHHPSLAVYPERGTFCCFACGERGDVIRFRIFRPHPRRRFLRHLKPVPCPTCRFSNGSSCLICPTIPV